MNSGKVFLGLLAGIATGAVLGILFAPDKGSTTRQKMMDKKDEYAKELEQKLNGFVDGLSKKVELVKDKAMSSMGKNES
jgi:gas vesicle protein